MGVFVSQWLSGRACSESWWLFEWVDGWNLLWVGQRVNELMSDWASKHYINQEGGGGGGGVLGGGGVSPQREWMSALQKDLWTSRGLRIWLIGQVAVLIGDVRGCWFVIFIRLSEWMSMWVTMSVWLIKWIDWIAYITEFSNSMRPCVNDSPGNIFMWYRVIVFLCASTNDSIIDQVMWQIVRLVWIVWWGWENKNVSERECVIDWVNRWNCIYHWI